MVTILANKSGNKLLLSLRSPHLFLVALIFTSIILETELNVITNVAGAQESDQVQKLWETPAQLKTPESVLYEPIENVLFVSSIDGKPDEKDGQGFVSKVSPADGSILELSWVVGLNAPKGMGVSGQIINRHSAPESAFLNDVASDKQGNIFVSDTGTNTTYKLENNNTALRKWLRTPELNSPNGLYIDNITSKLVVASRGGSLSLVDLQNKTITKLGAQVPAGSLDGIEADTGQNLYYVTDWTAGKVYAVNSDGTDYRTLIDLQKQGTADLEFIESERMVIIPMMQDNKLIAYRVLE